MMTRRLIPRAWAGRSKPTAEARSRRSPTRLQGMGCRLNRARADDSPFFRLLQVRNLVSRFFFPFPALFGLNGLSSGGLPPSFLFSLGRILPPRLRIVGLDDLLHQGVAHDIHLGEITELDALDVV